MTESNGGVFHDPQLLNGADVSLLAERELPHVFDGQIPLGDLLSRVMQAIFAENNSYFPVDSAIMTY